MAELQYFSTETHVLFCNEAAISLHYIKTICTFVTNTLCKLCSSTFGSGWVVSPVLVLLTQRSWCENIITRVAPCRVAPEFQSVCFLSFQRVTVLINHAGSVGHDVVCTKTTTDETRRGCSCRRRRRRRAELLISSGLLALPPSVRRLFLTKHVVNVI